MVIHLFSIDNCYTDLCGPLSILCLRITQVRAAFDEHRFLKKLKENYAMRGEAGYFQTIEDCMLNLRPKHLQNDFLEAFATRPGVLRGSFGCRLDVFQGCSEAFGARL